MRALIQRVSEASVTADGDVVGSIGPGLVAFVGVNHTDTDAEAAKLAGKIAKLRILDDDDGVMNRSVLDDGAEVLVVSQFTLYGDTRKGNRPSWIAAAKPNVAEPLIERLVAELESLGVSVATGRFRTDMAVALVNQGPATVLVDVDAR